jgi:hypothetical protein
MAKSTPKVPPIQQPIPVPQLDSPGLIDVARQTRVNAEDQEGTFASLLTPGGMRGVIRGSGNSRKTLGNGSISG